MKAKVVIVAIADDPFSEDIDELKERIKMYRFDPGDQITILDVVAEEVK